MIYTVSRFIFWVLLKILCNLEVIGRENLPKMGPFIVASNHVSYADPAAVGVTCTRRLAFMAKKELFEDPWFGWWFRAMGCIPIDRSSPSSEPLKRAIKTLREGKPVAIFPEGMRSADGALQKGEPGIGFIARKTKVPIIPFYTSGTEKALPKGNKPIHPHKVIVKIGKAIDISDDLKLFNKKKINESISNRVMDAITRLKNE